MMTETDKKDLEDFIECYVEDYRIEPDYRITDCVYRLIKYLCKTPEEINHYRLMYEERINGDEMNEERSV